MNNLFRKEVAENKRVRLWSEVLLVQPKSYKYLVGLCFLILIVVVIFATTQTYKRKETVSGFLAAKDGITKIYADRGGVVDTVLVKPGDFIKKGQPLITLKFARLLSSGVDSAYELEESLKRELKTYTAHVEELDEIYEKELRLLKRNLAGKRTELKAMNKEKGLLERRLELSEKQQRSINKLVKNGHVSQIKVDERIEQTLIVSQQLAGIEQSLARLSNGVDSIESQIEFQLPHRKEKEKTSLQAKIENVSRQLSSTELLSGYTISAPVSGHVSNILIHEGSATASGRPLLLLTPKDTQLIAQLLVPSRAAGLIDLNQKASIQYDAFPYQRFGVFSATVTEVSEGIINPSELLLPVAMQTSFYLVELTLDEQVVRVKEQAIRLKPGMQLKADIVLEERSLAEWIILPLLDFQKRHLVSH